jgi:hypothetical protein
MVILKLNPSPQHNKKPDHFSAVSTASSHHYSQPPQTHHQGPLRRGVFSTIPFTCNILRTLDPVHGPGTLTEAMVLKLGTKEVHRENVFRTA